MAEIAEDDEDENLLSRPEMERVIERAAQLDALRLEGVSVAQVQEIAKQLDISPGALRQAVDELMLERRAVIEPRERKPPMGVVRWLDQGPILRARGVVESVGTVGRIAGAIGFGLMMELTGDPIVPWVCLIGMVILSVATALPRRRQKSVAKYLGEITLQWVAWTVGIMTAFGGFWDDPIFIAVPLAAFVAVAGSWLRHMINVPMQQPTA